MITFALIVLAIIVWRGVRVVEGARLESVYRSQAYRGFESPSLRIAKKPEVIRAFLLDIK